MFLDDLILDDKPVIIRKMYSEPKTDVKDIKDVKDKSNNNNQDSDFYIIRTKSGDEPSDSEEAPTLQEKNRRDMYFVHFQVTE